MLSSFWRRKNGRLVKRLNAAIEASERLSEVYNAPKPPRVVIDTSYVERRHRQPTIARNYEDDPNSREQAMPMTGMPAQADMQGLGQGETDRDGAEWQHAGQEDQASMLPENENAYAQGEDENWESDILLLKQAAEQLELAELREAQALRELEGLRRKTEEIEALRKELAQAAAERTKVDTNANVSEAIEEIAALRSRNEELAAEAARAREALSRSDSEIKTARKAMEAARQEASDLRHAAAKVGELEKELAAAGNRESASATLAGSLATRLAEADAKITGIESERDFEREKAQKEADKAAAEIAALHLAAERLAKQHAGESDEASKRREALVRDVKTLRANIADLESKHAKEREEAGKAADKANEEIAALRVAAQKLAENKVHESSDADRRTAEALAQVDSLREQITKIEESRQSERQSASKAAAEATAEIESLRLAAQKIAASQIQRATEEGDKIGALQNELEALHKRAGELETALSAAEAARLSAELDRDNARQDAQKSEARLAALGTPPPAQSFAPEHLIADPPVFRTTSAKTDVATPANARPQSTGDERKWATASVLAKAAEGASPRHDEHAPRQNAIMSPQAPQAPEFAARDPDIPGTPGQDERMVNLNHPGEHTAGEDDIDLRSREKRVASRMAVTLWTEAWGQPLSCFLVDKSSRGAKIEMKPDRIFGGNNRINVGDRLTLTFYYPQERTSVFCDVMWMDGNFLGVKYYGQFNTEYNRLRANAKRS